MKIYTKTGDDGSTGLIGGQRVPKSSPAIDCFGTVDELNAAIGVASVVADTDLLAILRQVQNDLFVIGSHLSLSPGKAAPANQHLPPIHESLATRLESQIDAAQATLPPLKNFILPGGNELAARLHLARTICRRAERAIVLLTSTQPVLPLIVIYLNRLSDWLFVQARLANHIAGVKDVPWEKQP
jgi:cob(I)alamin adenosyltransferase